MVNGSFIIDRRFSCFDFILMLLMACPILLYVTPVRGMAIYIYSLFVPLIFILGLVRGVKIDYYYFFLFFGSVLFACYWILYFNSGSSKALPFSVNFFVSLGMGFLLFRIPRVAVWTSNVTVIFLFIWYFSCLLFIGYSPADANNYLYGASRNHVSFLLILSLIFYYSTYIYLDKRFSIVPVILMLPASIQLYGRSGILISFFLFSVIFLYRVFGNRRRDDVVWGAVLVGVFSFLLLPFLFMVIGVGDSGFWPTAFNKGIESSRWAMAMEYFRSLDFVAFSLGSDLNAIPLIANYNGNPHNSYIVGHSIYGFFFIVFLLFAFLLVGFKLIFSFSRKRLALTLLFFLLALRAYFDSLFFYSAFDYIFLYILIILAVGKIEPKISLKHSFS